MKQIICGIYKITSPANRVYIGQSINCYHRRNQYSRGCKKQPKLHNSIIKYGWDSHKFEIIHICTEPELNEMEIYYANIFNCYDKNFGLNIRECGGSKGRHSEESIIKCRLAKLGKKNTQEHIENVRLARVKLIAEGKFVVWNKGKKGCQVHTKETREKKRKKMTGSKRADTHKQNCKLSWETRKSSPEWNSIESKNERSIKFRSNGNNRRFKILNTQNGIFYDSLREVSICYCISRPPLSKKLKGIHENDTNFILI